MKLYLGIDVGSISTNFVLMDDQMQVVKDLYLRTSGNPIRAVKEGLKQLSLICQDKDILGCGATGSARKLTGVIIGADLVKNEITAHAKAAVHFVPDVRTVLEIGGQDSKIIIVRSGHAVDFAMNSVCLKSNSKVTTNEYFQKSICELKPGDKVLTHKGRFRKIEKIYERKYQGEMLKIKCSDSKKLEVTPEHPILAIKREAIKCYQSYSRGNVAVCKPPGERVCRKRCIKYKNFSWEPKFVLASKLNKGDFIATPLPSLINNTSYIKYSQLNVKEPAITRPFKKIDKFVFKPELLRLLGYYLAEGNILYNKARGDKKVKYPCGIAFTFNIREQDYIRDISDIISRNLRDITVKIVRKPARKTATVEVYSKTLSQFVKYLCSSQADKKELSLELLYLDPILQKEILKGFFRGDGQLRKRPKRIFVSNKQGNRYCASTVSEKLAYQLYWLLLRNKIKCTIRRPSGKTKGNKHAYFITTHGEEINKLEDRQIVDPNKKCDKSFIYSNWFFEPIKEIKKYHIKEKVYNLKVEHDDSYVADLFAVHNCAAGTGAFLDAQAERLKIPIEKFGELALKSKNNVNIAGRCTVFAESDMIHKQQTGHLEEDIINGLCNSLVRNYLNNVGRGKDIQPPIVFQGGVSCNTGMVKAFERALGHKIIVPKYNTVMGALGMCLLLKDLIDRGELKKTTFRGFKTADLDIKTTSFECRGCPNHCEIIEARIEGEVVSRWGDRCGKWSNQ